MFPGISVGRKSFLVYDNSVLHAAQNSDKAVSYMMKLKWQALPGLLLCITLLAGCGGQSQEPEPEVPEPEPEIETSTLEGEVLLEEIRITGEGLTLRTSHETHGSSLIPLSLVEYWTGEAAVSGPTGEGIGFSVAGREASLWPGTALWILDGEEKTAPGPSFYRDGELYVRADILETMLPGARISPEGVILPAPWTVPEGEPGPGEPPEPAAAAAGLLGDQSLVNKDYPIGEGAGGEDLVNLNRTYSGHRYHKSDMLFDREAAAALDRMLKDSDLDIQVVSTYRPYAYQKDLFARKVTDYMNRFGYDRETATREAGRIVAVPGTSEHQSGRAVDFTSPVLTARGQYLEQSFLTTEEGRWLRDNSWKYGFILRYPENTEDITGIMEEAWHYRYVGVPQAGLIMRESLVLESWLGKMQEAGRILTEEPETGTGHLLVWLTPEEAGRVLLDPRVARASDTNTGGILVTVSWQLSDFLEEPDTVS